MGNNASRREFGKKLAALVSGTALFGHQASCTSLPQSEIRAEDLQKQAADSGSALLIDDATRQAAGEDFGLIVRHEPIAVLKPRQVKDVSTIVRLANRRGLKVAMRGQGHAMFGQAQAPRGIVIDSSTLNSVRMINFRGTPAVEADAGALWGQVLDLAYQNKLTPVVNVDPVYLSVGGTISTGGFGATSWRDGFQTDHVLQLVIVTGRGDLVTCSDATNSEFFNAALGGMGQCGLIVKAVIELTAAPTHVRFFVLAYPDLQSATADMVALVKDGRFDHLDGRTARRKDGGFVYNLEAGAFYDAPHAPSDTNLLTGLKFQSQTARTLSYAEYYRRVPALRRMAHPWLYLCVPGSRFVDYASTVYATPAEFAYSLPRFSVWQKNRVKRPLMRLPDEELIVRFQCSRNPPATADVSALIAMNRTLFERARAIGGTRLITSALPLSQADWIQNFGPAWPAFSDAKRQFDPRNVLTPGPGIFAS